MPRKLRDYSYKRFSNPMFERRNQPSKRALLLRRVLGLTALLAVIGGGSWFLFWSDIFAIKTISVGGNERVATWEIEDAVKQMMHEHISLILPKSNILLLSENELRGRLVDQFVFASVDITKHPPNELDIQVKERVSSILLRMPDGNRAVLDLSGTVLRLYRSDEPDPEAYLLQHQVLCDTQAVLALRGSAADARTVSAVIAAPDVMSLAFPDGPTIKETHLEKLGGHTMRLVTSEGWVIYVDANAQLGGQLQNAAVVLKEKVRNDRPKLDYIDVRFGDKVFFKLK